MNKYVYIGIAIYGVNYAAYRCRNQGHWRQVHPKIFVFMLKKSVLVLFQEVLHVPQTEKFANRREYVPHILSFHLGRVAQQSFYSRAKR